MNLEAMCRLLAIALLLGGWARVQAAPPCSETAGSVYKIAFYDGAPRSVRRPKQFGAGIFLSESGTFLTARHLFEDATGATAAEVEVVDGGRWFACPVVQVIASSRARDIVQVRVKLQSHKVSVPRLGPRANVGEPVRGFRVPPPFASAWHPITGIVCTEGWISASTAEEIEIRGEQFLTTGSSGSPILNASGEVVAIAVEMINRNLDGSTPEWTYKGLRIAAALGATPLPLPRPVGDFLLNLQRER